MSPELKEGPKPKGCRLLAIAFLLGGLLAVASATVLVAQVT